MTTLQTSDIKGISELANPVDGSNLRVAIIHARWNASVIDALVKGTISKLKERGVKDNNIYVETVPGSFELPFACSKVISGSKDSGAPFDAVIAIGVLIKGSTMHFEYICDSVSHGLMKLQLDSGTPVIFGVLTALTEDQALDRAGIGRGADKGHNHGEDWGNAAVEMGANSKRWAAGQFKALT